MAEWQMQVAKNKLSEVVERAQEDGPQFLTRHGRTTAVVLSFSEYQSITRPKQRLIDFIRNSPLRGLHVRLERNRAAARDVEL